MEREVVFHEEGGVFLEPEFADQSVLLGNRIDGYGIPVFHRVENGAPLVFRGKYDCRADVAVPVVLRGAVAVRGADDRMDPAGSVFLVLQRVL